MRIFVNGKREENTFRRGSKANKSSGFFDSGKKKGGYAKDRPRLTTIQGKKKTPRTSLQIKSDFINKLSDVGLFDKIAVMAEQTDPETEEGKQVLGFFMRYVVKDILPKETASKIEHSEGTGYDKMTDAELLQELQSRRQERLEYTEEIQEAEKARLSYNAKEVKDGEDRPGEDT